MSSGGGFVAHFLPARRPQDPGPRVDLARLVGQPARRREADGAEDSDEGLRPLDAPSRERPKRPRRGPHGGGRQRPPALPPGRPHHGSRPPAPARVGRRRPRSAGRRSRRASARGAEAAATDQAGCGGARAAVRAGRGGSRPGSCAAWRRRSACHPALVARDLLAHLLRDGSTARPWSRSATHCDCASAIGMIAPSGCTSPMK